MRTPEVLWGALLLLAAAVPSGAQAWEAQAAPRWGKSAFPIPWAINAAGAGDVRDGSDLEAVEAAFGAWSEPACTFATVSRQEDFGHHADLSDCSVGDNWVQWEERTWPEELGPNVLAVTLTCFVGGTRINTSMRFNGVDHTWGTTGRARAFDIGSVATHEAGHVLGLGHSDLEFATMFRATGPGDVSQRTLSFDDEAGICALYPLGVPGEACEDDRVCEQASGGLAYCEVRWEGGYCTLGCESGCPTGSRCGVAPGETEERCLDVCLTSEEDCRAGYACHWTGGGFGVCAPQCINDAACGDGQACVEGTCRTPSLDAVDAQATTGCAAASGGGGGAGAVVVALLAARRRRRTESRSGAPPLTG